MDEEPQSLETGPHQEKRPARKWLALGLLAGIAGLAWKTMDPDKVRSVVLVLLAVFAARILLVSSASR